MSAPVLAWRWRRGALEPITHVQHVDLDTLVGIERQKAAFLANVERFVRGRPCNHALLTGARGTGKSSLVKAALPAFAAEGLRVVEVSPHDLLELPDIASALRPQPERYLLYVDDFSVGANDPRLTALKTALDGGIEAPPENLLIVATSNRRHLLPTSRADNGEYRWEGDELHPGESTEEKISLSERFGLWLSFPPFSQDTYLAAVRTHLAAHGVPTLDEAIREAALRFALERGSRSGRVARQFVRTFV